MVQYSRLNFQVIVGLAVVLFRNHNFESNTNVFGVRFKLDVRDADKKEQAHDLYLSHHVTLHSFLRLQTHQYCFRLQQQLRPPLFYLLVCRAWDTSVEFRANESVVTTFYLMQCMLVMIALPHSDTQQEYGIYSSNLSCGSTPVHIISRGNGESGNFGPF